MTYTNTFIAVAEDCRVDRGVVPEPRAGKPTIASVTYELLASAPYSRTHDEVLFDAHVTHKGLDGDRDTLWEEFWAKPKACLRASPLTKQHGWGVHCDADGRVALHGMETEEYRRFAAGEVEGVKVMRAMRSRRG